jgi:hypothetical protein
VDSAGLWWETFETGDVDVGFMSGMHDGSVSAGYWNRLGGLAFVLDRAIPATEVTRGGGVRVTW